MLDKKYNFSPIIALNICLASIAFIIVFSLPQQASASPFGEPIYRVLMDTSSGMGEITARVWNATMNVVNSLVLVLLIYIAFMNILRIQIDSYAVKKFLPTFIMTIILANFSFLIARIIIDIGNITIALFLVGNEQNALTGAFDELIDKVPIAPGKQEAGENYFAVINAYIFKQFFIITGAVMMFILSFVFIVRNYMLYFLIAIAPLGFLSMALPSTKKYFQQWWSNFTKWVFMPVISVFWLWLGGQFVTAVSTGYWILPVSFGILCLYMAITTPFKVGGAVLGAWGKLGKQAWGKTGGQITGAAKGEFNRYANLKKMNFTNKMMETNLGKKYEKLTARRRFQEQLPVDVRNKAKSNAERDVYQQAYRDHITGRKILPDAAFSRVKARNRKEIADNQITFRGGEVEALHELLGQHGALDNNGRLKGEADLAALAPDKYIDIKTILKEIREQTQRGATRDAAIPVWKQLTYRDDVDPRNNVRRAKFATASDIAGDVLPMTPEQSRAAAEAAARGEGKPPNFTYKSPEELNIIERENPQAFEYPPRRRRTRDIIDDNDFDEATSAVPNTGSSDYHELTGYMQELVSEFRNLEEQLGGQGSLGGEGGYDQLLGEISKMKPNLTLSDAGLAAAILPVMKVRIESMDPTALEQWGRKIRQVSEGVNKMTAGIEAENASVLRQIATVIRDGANPSKLAEGRQAIGEAADTDEGEGNG
jgi:hypothetical protein